MTNPSNETQYPLIVHIRKRTRDDTELNGIIERRAYNSRGEVDSAYPYITFWIDNSYSDNGLIAESTLYTNLWDNAEDKLDILKMRGDMIRLFERYKVSLDGVVAARFFLEVDGNVPEDDRNIWHHTMQWNLRYDRKVELNQIYEVS